LAENGIPTAIRPRGPGKPFVKGQSANPGGRPALFPEFREECRSHSPKALAKLLEALREPGASAQSIKAAELILAYGWGKPTQVVDINGEVKVTLESLVLDSLKLEIA
jgi:hypothetical protein